MRWKIQKQIFSDNYLCSVLYIVWYSMFFMSLRGLCPWQSKISQMLARFIIIYTIDYLWLQSSLMSKIWYVYIMTNHKHGTLYVGVTSNLIQRIYQHRESLIDWFTRRYQLYTLVYYEEYLDIQSAIMREKQLKAWNRKRKIALIEQKNPYWKDLYGSITD